MKLYIISLILFCFFCSSIAGGSNISSRKLLSMPNPSQEMNFFRKLPRYKFDGGFQPENPQYYEALAILGIPFFILAVISLLSWVIALCCCCRSKKEKYASRAYIYFFRLIIAIICLIFGAACVFALSANVATDQLTNQVFDPVTSLESDYVNDVSTLENLLEVLNATGPVQEQITTTVTSIKQIHQATLDAQKLMQQSQLERDAVLYLIYGVGIIAAGVGILSAICIWSRGIFLMVLLSILTLPFIWIISGILVPVDTFLSDACVDPKGYLIEQSDTQEQVWINYYLNCQGNSPLENAATFAENSLNQTQIDLAEAIAYHASQSEIDELKQIIQDLQSIIQALGDLSDCTKTEVVWTNLYNSICTDIFKLTTGLLWSSLVGGVFLSLAIIFGLISYQKLSKAAMEGYRPLYL